MDNLLTSSKRLPRKAGSDDLAPTFPANGHTYRWLAPAEVDIRAWTVLSNFMDVFWSGFDTYQAVSDYHRETALEAMKIEDLGKLKFYIAGRQQNYLDSIVQKSKQRSHLSMHIAAILTLREGDDVRRYSTERAEEYIADWTEEGYSWADFFAVAGSLSASFREDFRRTQKRIIEKENQALGSNTNLVSRGKL